MDMRFTAHTNISGVSYISVLGLSCMLLYGNEGKALIFIVDDKQAFK